MRDGPIFALDIAINLGVAIGRPGGIPIARAVRLKKPGEGREVACSNLIAYLQEAWAKERPGLLFKEAPLALAGFAMRSNSEATVRLTFGLHAIAEAMAHRFGISFEERAVASIRKHFIGSSGRGERQATKRAVITRCHILGYLDRDCLDDNMADALAAWDFAAAHIGRVPPKELHLFNEGASR